MWDSVPRSLDEIGTEIMRKILITGINSFIGNSFENWIKNNFNNDYCIDKISLREKAVSEVDFSCYDVVLYVTGIAHADTNKKNKSQEELYYKINTDLTFESAKKAKNDGVSQFIFLSSIIVYSNSGRIGEKKIIDINTKESPAGFYGDSKLKADKKIMQLNNDNFKVVSVRPPMIYGKGAKGNYPKLSRLSKILPVFPDIKNERSMIYIDNLCEFLRLVIDNNENGYFYPQNREYVSTIDMVKTIAAVNGKKIRGIKLFNPIIKAIGSKIDIINKVFGNLVYDKSMSDYLDFKYCVFDFEQSIQQTEK